MAMFERIYCKTLIALMSLILLCIVLIPTMRTGRAAWPFALYQVAGIAVNLLYLRARKAEKLPRIVSLNPGGLIACVVLAVPVLYVAQIISGDRDRRQTTLFKDAVQQMQDSDIAKADLGVPIKIGWPTEENTNEKGTSGNATIGIPVYGSHGRGELIVVATETNSVWSIDELTLILDDGKIKESLKTGSPT